MVEQAMLNPPLLATDRAAPLYSLQFSAGPLHQQPRSKHQSFQSNSSNMTEGFFGLQHPLNV